VPIVLKSGSLNLLEPSGPVKGCNGIALPYTSDKARIEMEVSSKRICRAEFKAKGFLKNFDKV
jgi:hypothetical protein